MSKLRIFETFAGIGSQTKALDNIKADYEVVATSEWYTDQSLITMHFIE